MAKKHMSKKGCLRAGKTWVKGSKKRAGHCRKKK